MSSPNLLDQLPKLTPNNYALWSPLMKNHLRMHLVWGLVSGREGAPTSPQDVGDYFVRQDLATSQIFFACSPEIQVQISDIDDPAHLWRHLHEMSEKKTMVDEYRLRKRLYSIELRDCGSVARYVGTIQDTVNEIERCNPNEPVGPAQHCFVMCDGLPESWLETVGEWHKMGKTSRKPEELIKLLLEHEAKLNEEETQRPSEPAVPPEPTQNLNPNPRGRRAQPVEEAAAPPPPPPPPSPPSPPPPEAARNILVRSRYRFYNIRDTTVSFYYTHPLSVHYHSVCGIPAASVITDHLHILYPELCRRIFTNDRRQRFITGNEQVGDVVVYIRPSVSEEGDEVTGSSSSSTLNNQDSGEAEVEGSGTGTDEGSKVGRKRFVDWVFETPDWRQRLLDTFWEFPGGVPGDMVTLEVEYEDSYRVSSFFSHEREFESLGVTLEMFFPPEGDMEL